MRRMFATGRGGQHAPGQARGRSGVGVSSSLGRVGGRCHADWTRCLACSSGRNLFHVELERMKVESSVGAASVRAREGTVTAPSSLGTKENLALDSMVAVRREMGRWTAGGRRTMRRAEQYSFPLRCDLG